MPRLKNGRQSRKKAQKGKKKLVVAMGTKSGLRSHAAKENKGKEIEDEIQNENEVIQARPKRSKAGKRSIEEDAQKTSPQKNKVVRKTATKSSKKAAKSNKATSKSKNSKRKAKATEAVLAKRQKLQNVEEMMPEYGEVDDYHDMRNQQEAESLVLMEKLKSKAHAKSKPIRHRNSKSLKATRSQASQLIIENVPRHDTDDEDDAPEEDDDDMDDSLFFGIPIEKSPDYGNCSHCKKKFRRQELADHLTICPERYVQCRECNKVLSNLQTLERHHKRFHLKLREVPCTLCDKMFIDEAAARKHLKTVHFKVKNFHCPHCDKSFSQRNKLTYHVRTHSGEKPFSCAECGRSFSLLWNLKTHLRTHTGEKPYACDICGRKFTQKQNMTSHMTTHKKPKVARSNSFVSFSGADNLDYFSMSELRQSAKATMVHSNQSSIKVSQINENQGAQYLIDHLGNVTPANGTDSISSQGIVTLTQSNEFENGLGLLSSVARKGENDQGCDSVEVDGIVDQAHISHQIGHASGMDQVVEVLVQPQGGDGDPAIAISNRGSGSKESESFVSTSKMEEGIESSVSFQNTDTSNVVTASVATMQQQNQVAGAQNVVPIGNANLSGLANILQNPEVLAAINAAAASNKFIVIGPVGMLSGQTTGTSNTVSIATSFSNDGSLSSSVVDSDIVANFSTNENMATDEQRQSTVSQAEQPLMQIAAVDHLDAGLSASCDVEMIPADTSQDASNHVAATSDNEAGNEVQSSQSDTGALLQTSSTVTMSSNIAADTSSVHSYAANTGSNYYIPENSRLEAEVVSSQDEKLHEASQASSVADGEQVSSSAENDQPDTNQVKTFESLGQVHSSKDKDTVQSSDGVSSMETVDNPADCVYNANIVSSFMADDKLVTQSTNNAASNDMPNSQNNVPPSEDLVDSGTTVSAAQTSGEAFIQQTDEGNHSYIVKIGDQFVSSSMQTSSVPTTDFITSSVLSGSGQSMVMVTADGQSYFTAVNLPQGFDQGNNQITLVDSVSKNFSLPALDGAIPLESLFHLQAGTQGTNTIFSTQFENAGSGPVPQSGTCNIQVEEGQEVDESAVTDSTTSVMPNTNKAVLENTENSAVSDSSIISPGCLQANSGNQQNLENSLDDRVDSHIDSVNSNQIITCQDDRNSTATNVAVSSGTDFQSLINATNPVPCSSNVDYDSVVTGTEGVMSGELSQTDQFESQRTGVTSSNTNENSAQSFAVTGSLVQTNTDEQGDSLVSTSLQVSEV